MDPSVVMWQLTDEQHERFLRLIKLEVQLENNLKYLNGRLAGFRAERRVPLDSYTLGRVSEMDTAAHVLTALLAEVRGEKEVDHG